MDDRRVRLESRIQQLLAAGKSPDEIRGMKADLVAELNSPEGGARQQMGPTPAGSPSPDAYPMPQPMDLQQAQEQRGILGSLAHFGRTLAGAPGELAADPSAAPRSLVTGGALAATAGRARDLHGPALEQMRGKAAAGALTPDDLQTLSMWQDVANPGRERTPITNPTAAIDELLGSHARAQAATAGQPGLQAVGGLAIAPATIPGRAAGLTGKVVGGATAPITEGLTGLTGAAARTAAAGARGAAGGAAASLTGDAMAGNFEGMLDRAQTNAGTSALLGGATAAAGEALGGVRNAVVNSKGGKARQTIEAAGGSVSPISPGRKGPFAPGGRLAGKQPTDRDIGTVARDSAGNILRGMESDLDTALSKPLGEKAALDAANKGRVVVNDMVTALEEIKQSERLTPGEQSTVESWLNRLDKYEVLTPDGEGTGIYAMPVKQLNDFRGMLSDSTGVGGEPGSVAAAKMQKVAGVAKALVDQTDYGPVNEQISGARTKYEGGRRLLGLNDRQASGAMAPEGVPNSEINRVTNMMARQGQNTVTAGGQNTAGTEEAGVPAQERLKQLAEQFPQYAKDVSMPEVLRAKGDLGFRLLPDSGKGGLIERLKSAAPAIAGAGGAAAAGAMGHPGLSLGLGALTLGALNSPAIMGRLMYRPALMAGGAGQAMASSAPYAGLPPVLFNQLDATMARKRMKEKR